MGRRKVPFVNNEYYHIYNRGNSKQKIFLDKEDYKHFVKLLFVCNSNKKFKFRDNIIFQKIDAFDFERGEQLVSIGSWVLMPNHFHLYLTVNLHMSDMWRNKNKNGISEFLRKLLTAYTKYFNAKYCRAGTLYEGPFKSVHIENDNQARYLFSYIHLNPLKLINKNWKEEGFKNKREALDFLKNYRYSSYVDFKGVERKETKILNLEDFPKYFNNIQDFDNDIMNWLKYKDK